jgi:hypothetical protein
LNSIESRPLELSPVRKYAALLTSQNEVGRRVAKLVKQSQTA